MSAEPVTDLPPQLTSFVGRQRDLAAIRDRLADPACRLLALVGPGGIGKTRLALEAAATERQAYDDGLFFVPLQSASSTPELISAIADVLSLALSGSGSQQEQLAHFLRHKTVLLLLDNFEQLLSPGLEAPDAARDGGCVTFLSYLLSNAPGVDLLVTSREALRLQEEWLYPVEGLSYPADADVPDLLAYDAPQLFVSRARRVLPDFAPDKEARAITDLCRLVDGMPLALELAATWVRSLSCAEIATEIAKSVAFLQTSLRNVTPRHRSMVAVFEQTWSLLSVAEQNAFQELSVFRGGFLRPAAEIVAGATLPLLSALVDKSMLRRDVNGRYQIHELLRQFGEVRLAETDAAASETRDRHCRYYMDFLEQRLPHVNDRRQRQAAAEIVAELDNVRVAWQWAVQRGDVDALARGVSTYFYFCQIQCRYLESAEALANAVSSLRQVSPSPKRDFVLARALTHEGWMRIRLGQFDKAASVLEKSRELYKRLHREPLPYMGTDPATPLAIVALIRGEHEHAVTLAEEALRAAETRQDGHNLSFAHYALTAARYAQGHYEAAYAHAESACRLAHAVGNDWFLPYALNEWGNVSRAMGDIAEARRHFQASYELKEAFEDREGKAVALNHLAELAILQGDYAEAQSLYHQALSLYQDLNDRGGLATSLKGLGHVAAAQGHDESARQQFAQALRIAADIEYWPLVFSIFIDVAPLLHRMRRSIEAVELLSMAQRHAGSSEEVKDRATMALERSRQNVSPERLAAAHQRAATQSLNAAIVSLQTVLDLSATELEQAFKAQPPDQQLAEPLTEREIEVLQLIAAGKTNAEIAEALVLALGTVKWYASEIYGKLGVTNRTEAAARGGELGLLN